MDRPPYAIEAIVSAPFDQVAYVIWDPQRCDALVVDPGFDVDSIERLLGRKALTVSAILNTHGHADHIAGNARMKARHPSATLVIGRDERHLLEDPTANLSAGFGLDLTSPPADRLVDDAERIEFAGFALLVRTIPGHSPGSVVYIAEKFDPPLAIVGDVLFAGSVGRTDLPGGDFRTLSSGIRTKLFTLPGATIVLPGHGPTTTIGAERRGNPFVGERVCME
jgi:glyoxylase-like metal-dependent hydrolase (beta-lactamase superfamily II)